MRRERASSISAKPARLGRSPIVLMAGPLFHAVSNGSGGVSVRRNLAITGRPSSSAVSERTSATRPPPSSPDVRPGAMASMATGVHPPTNAQVRSCWLSARQAISKAERKDRASASITSLIPCKSKILAIRPASRFGIKPGNESSPLLGKRPMAASMTVSRTGLSKGSESKLRRMRSR